MTDPGLGTTRDRWMMLVPAAAVGVLAGLVLWVVDVAAEAVRHVWWQWGPQFVGVDPDSGGWIFAILTLTGVLIGLVRWKFPGQGGIDSATVEMAQPAQPLRDVPGIAIAAILMLAGGVSLGPEAPVIGIVIALTVAALVSFRTVFETDEAVMIAIAATIGALFGTPVAAALLITSAFTSIAARGALWDRLCLPLAAAGAGSIVTQVVGGGIGALPGFGTVDVIGIVDVLGGVLIAVVAAGLGVASGWLLPPVHAAFRRWIRNPFLIPVAGGVILGVLGAIGGPMTLFKGLDEGAELVADAGDTPAGTLALIIGVKILAVVVSAGAWFPGGRIFPAVFVGIATGLLGAELLHGVALGVAVACGILGYVIAVSHDGWLALFAGVAIVGDVGLLPLLCIIVVPVWLLVSKAPEMIVRTRLDA